MGCGQAGILLAWPTERSEVVLSCTLMAEL